MPGSIIHKWRPAIQGPAKLVSALCKKAASEQNTRDVHLRVCWHSENKFPCFTPFYWDFLGFFRGFSLLPFYLLLFSAPAGLFIAFSVC